MSKFVKISATKTVVVTAGLDYEDKTNTKNPHATLNVQPTWTKRRVTIYAGKHTYPTQITEWNTVKALVKAGILTIGEETNDATDDKTNPEDVEKKLEETETAKTAKKNKPNIAKAPVFDEEEVIDEEVE